MTKRGKKSEGGEKRKNNERGKKDIWFRCKEEKRGLVMKRGEEEMCRG